MFVRAAVALIAVIGASATASAAPSGSEREGLRRYCSTDYVAHCSEYDIDSPKVQACFKRNRSRLSAPCRDAISGYLKSERRRR